MFIATLGHMAQLGKKNLNLFQALCKEKAAKAKSAGNTKVPNLQDLLVKVHVHGGTTRKVEVPAKQGGRKDVNRVRATLLGSGSSSKVKKPEPSLIELPETTVQCDIEINLAESLVNSIDNIEPNAMVKDVLEFNNKALILGHRLGSLLQREMKEGGWSNVEELREELKIQADKHTEEKATWKKEKEEWLEERKRLGSWRVKCLDYERKRNENIIDLETNYDELKEEHDGLKANLRTWRAILFKSTSTVFKRVCGKRPSSTKMLMRLTPSLTWIKMWWMGNLWTKWNQSWRRKLKRWQLKWMLTLMRSRSWMWTWIRQFLKI